jgi:DNA mismatch endonuclease (patch repair protein)
MQGNRSRDTRAEMAIRRIVHAHGLRYLVNAPPVPNIRRTADLLFPRAKVAVFVDGCYWHGCPEHFTLPRKNVEYWSRKIAGNRARDLATTSILEERGWVVLRFWEHDLPSAASEQIERVVRQRWTSLAS